LNNKSIGFMHSIFHTLYAFNPNLTNNFAYMQRQLNLFEITKMNHKLVFRKL